MTDSEPTRKGARSPWPELAMKAHLMMPSHSTSQRSASSALRFVGSFACSFACSFAASAQTITPIPVPPGGNPTLAPKATQKPAVPLPPPLSVSEQRFRDLSTYIKSRGTIDDATRADIVSLASTIDNDLNAPTTSREMMLRLLPARAQIAIWLGDDAALDSAFERLLDANPTSEAAAIAWARELIAAARFERAITVIEQRNFSTRSIDAKIVLGDAYTGILRFDSAQAAYNTAPQPRSPEQQQAISKGTFRVQALRDMWDKELLAMARDQARDDLPLVELVTTKGSIQLELFEEEAPATVGNFIEHVEAGDYDGTTFHRILRGLGAQGGDPATASGAVGGNSTGGWTIPDETDRLNRRSPLSGRVILAKQRPTTGAAETPAPHTGGVQFVILFAPREDLDGNYTVFGRVFDGLDTARALNLTDTIATARVIRKRAHEYTGTRFSTDSTGNYSMPRSAAEGGNQAPAVKSVGSGGVGGSLGTVPSATAPINLGPIPSSKPGQPASPPKS